MTVEPDEYGIWPSATAEHLVLPRPAKNAQCGPIALIALLQTPQGWIASAEYHFSNTSGGGYALHPKWCGGWLPSREAALETALNYLGAKINFNPEHPDAKALSQWITRGCKPHEVQQEIVF